MMQPSAPPQPPALTPGTLLWDRYFIQGYISGGGFGHIYKAHDKVLGHRRAIKEAFYRDPNTQRQFRLEAEFLINARHPNLVQGYALFEQAGRFYLVMDYVDGYTLEDITIQHIRRSGYPLLETQILDWIIPICDAVQSLHQQPMPIIHRDIKPANIKLNRQGVPVLIDLGLAKLYYRGSQTIGAALAFTPGYAPPEQYQASGATDQRTDVYAMGATLYYLLTGYQPTEAPARLSRTALPAPCRLNPALSHATEEAVLRAMSLDPADRQQAMGELMAEIQSARALLTTGKLPVTSVDEGRRIPCTRCGTANALAARFCMRCGNPMPAGETAGESSNADDAGRSNTEAPTAQSLHLIASSETPADQPLLGGEKPTILEGPSPTAATTPARMLASPYAASFAGEISQRLLHHVPTDNQEVLMVLSAILGSIAATLGLLAIISGWLLVFALPALGLAGWSCWHWWQRPLKVPVEFKWVSSATIMLSVVWIATYFLFFHIL
jgi:serine/threonine protein kinase